MMRLSPNMIELLTDIATHPQYYVGTWGKWGKCAHALRRRGMATVDAVDHAQSEVKMTTAGRDEAIRRGILCECGRIASCKCPDTGECGTRCACLKCRTERHCHCSDIDREQGQHQSYCPVVGGAGIPGYVPVMF